MYIVQTTANYPDVMVFKWKDNEMLQAAMFAFYIFFMGNIIMNILTGIFYGNYKSHFAKIAEGLSNQDKLCKIVDAATDKHGQLSISQVGRLLDTFHYESREKFQQALKKASFAKHKYILKKILRAREEKKKQENKNVDATETVDDFVPNHKRTSGYNKKHKAFFVQLSENPVYKYFFIILNILIAVKPIIMLDNDDKEQLFAFSVYDVIDMLILLSMIDPLCVIIFKGTKYLNKIFYKVELITSILILLMSAAINMYMTDTSNAYAFERLHPVVFTIYAFLCLSRIFRYIYVVVLSMNQVKAIGCAVKNMKPFFNN